VVIAGTRKMTSITATTPMAIHDRLNPQVFWYPPVSLRGLIVSLKPGLSPFLIMHPL
jgi:hypothetical protein